MKVLKQSNGQYEVLHNELQLTQTIINGERFNDASEITEDGNYTLISQDDIRLSPMFIALHNFKLKEQQ